MNAERKDPVSPHDYDRSTGQRVEKTPKEPESPQQQHDDEDQG